MPIVGNFLAVFYEILAIRKNVRWFTILRQQSFTSAQTFWLFKVYAEVVKSWLPRFATTLDAS